MKIEKINESQIRCTLTKADLESRKIKISELVYGSEKTKNLFRDMMEQASEKFGFQANDIPLMIEAIPLETGSILLIITKVTEPEELDTRFSNFSPSISHSSEDGFSIANSLQDSSEFSALYNKIKEISENAGNAGGHSSDALESKPGVSHKHDTETPTGEKESISCAYSFTSIQSLIKVADAVNDSYAGENSLYKDPVTNLYYLIIHSKNTGKEDFKKLCSVLSEYGELKPSIYGCTARIEEHCDLIIKDQALHKLI